MQNWSFLAFGGRRSWSRRRTEVSDRWTTHCATYTTHTLLFLQWQKKAQFWLISQALFSPNFLRSNTLPISGWGRKEGEKWNDTFWLGWVIAIYLCNIGTLFCVFSTGFWALFCVSALKVLLLESPESFGFEELRHHSGKVQYFQGWNGIFQALHILTVIFFVLF